jgi:crotonobetainyl-CoA:carnitine CoA-transferase CaiB-like acyl-CoA transferase
VFAALPREALVAKLERIGLPFAPIVRPDELFDDAHLNAAGGLLDVTIPGGATTKLPALPIELDGRRFALTRDLPAVGADSEAVFANVDVSAAELADFRARGVVD